MKAHKTVGWSKLVLTAFFVVGALTVTAVTSANSIFTPLGFNAGGFFLTNSSEPEPAALPLAQASEATINTNKDDYSPGQIVYISGSGWTPGETVQLQIVHITSESASALAASSLESATPPHEGHDPWDVVADANGNLAAEWLVREDSYGQTLLLTADGLTSGLHAEKIFYDAASISLEQCHNWDSGTETFLNCDDPYPAGQTDWGTGNAQSSNARLAEGKNQNFRAIMEEIEVGSYFITIELDLTKGGSVAYDRFSSPGRIRTAVNPLGNTKAGPGITPESQGVFPCADDADGDAWCLAESGVPYQIPAIPLGIITPSAGDEDFEDDVLAAQAADSPEYMFLYGDGDLGSPATWVYSFEGTNTETGDTMLALTMPINKTVGTGTLVLAWGGHVSREEAYVTSGHGTASTIEGSPYHMRLIDFTALQGDPGNQDMQMAASAIIVELGTITIIKDAVPNDAQDFQFTADNGLTPANFTLDDDADGTNPDRITFSDVPPGVYNVAETLGVPDWVLTDITCTDPNSGTTDNEGTGIATIDMSEGEDITCTFVNTQLTADIEVTKTVDEDEVCEGSSTLVTYTYQVSNNGTAPLPTVTVVDDNGTPANNADDFSPTFQGGDDGNNVLDPGETWTYSASRNLGATTTNTVTATGTTEGGQQDSDTASATVTAYNCTITVTKAADADAVCVGDSTTYDFSITNNSTQFTWTGTLVDDVVGDIGGGSFSLAPGQTLNFNDVAGPPLNVDTTNTVTGNGAFDDPASSSASDTASDTVTVKICTITVTKSADADAVCIGGSTTYDFSITNNSAEFTWTGTLVDDVVGDIGGGSFSLAPGQTLNFNDVAGPPLNVDTTNTVTGNGAFDDPASSSASDTASDTVTVEICTITVTKSADDDAVCIGGSTTYDFSITNNSETFTWTGTLVDDVVGDIGGGSFSLTPGQTLNFNNVAGPPLNVDTTNTVTGDGAFDDPASASASDTASDTVTVEICTITVTKSADDDAVCIGGSTTYDFSITNNSETFTWTGTFSDDVVGPIGSQPLVLAPGQTATFNDVAGPPLNVDTTNTVTGDGNFDDPASSSAMDSASDTVTVEICTITVTKSADDETICIGTTTTYDFSITNNSETFTWTGTLVDDVVGDIGGGSFSLTPGQTLNFNNVAGPTLNVDTTNTVTGNGAFDDPASASASDTASDTVNVVNCTITVTKVPSATNVCNGATVTYDFSITNNSPSFTWTGTFVDDVIGDIGGAVVLAPGATANFNNVPWVINGTVNNTVTGDGTFDDGTSSSATDTASATVTGNTCRIRVEKETLPDGDPASFSFSGDLSGSIGDGGSLQVDVLAPGAYSTTEAVPAGWDLTDITCDDGNSSGEATPIGPGGSGTATYNVELGEFVTCVFTNTKRGTVSITKTLLGGPIPDGSSFDFQLRQGASTVSQGTTLFSTTVDSTTVFPLQLNGSLVPGDYQVCEFIQVGWDSTIRTMPGAFVPESVSDPANVDNSYVCVPITIDPGENETITIDNRPPPDGMAKTIGFWKNHSSCKASNGGQDPVLDDVLATFPVADGESLPGFYIGDLYVDTCEEAYALLDKRTVDGSGGKGRGKKGGKSASDPAFNAAAQLVAAVLNVQAQADPFCVLPIIAETQALLDEVNFDGVTHDTLTPSEEQQLNTLAGLLDDYNNNVLICP